MSHELSKELSRFYSIFGWPEDPYSVAGKERFKVAIEKMRKLVEHEYLKELVGTKDVIKILELCGGTGIGGVALAKVIKDLGKSVELMVTDLREEALATARRWGSEVLGINVEAEVIDAREVHRLGREFDIALLYGFSTPHFNPWDMVKLLTSTSKVLSNQGVFLVEETDRRYTVFLRTGYKWVLVEPRAKGESYVISYHADYDVLTGEVHRLFTTTKKPNEFITMSVYFWGVAELATLMWLFFKDVDTLPILRTSFIVLGYIPRRILKPEDLKELPKIFKTLKTQGKVLIP